MLSDEKLLRERFEAWCERDFPVSFKAYQEGYGSHNCNSQIDLAWNAWRELAAAVRAEREGAAPALYQYRFQWTAGDVWRVSPVEWNGLKPVETRALYPHPQQASATVSETDPRYQHLLDMLGAKNHEDAARIIAGHHARELGEATVPEGWKLVRYDEKRVFIQMDSRFLIVRKASPDPAWRALYQLVMHMVGRGILAAAHNPETPT